MHVVLVIFGSWPVVAPVIVQREEYSQFGRDCNCNVDARVVSIEGRGCDDWTGHVSCKINSTPHFDLKEIGTTHPKAQGTHETPKNLITKRKL